MLQTSSHLFRPASLAAVLFTALSCGFTAQAEENQTAPLQASPNGQELWDLQARLAWMRCVYGMRWQGERCQGRPERLTYGQAQQLVKIRNEADGLRWRLPRAKELIRLRLRVIANDNPKQNLLPNAPAEWHWTGSASVNASPVNAYSYDQFNPGKSQLSVPQAWAMDWASGLADGEMGRGNTLVVRLVRALKPEELEKATTDKHEAEHKNQEGKEDKEHPPAH